MRRLRNSAFCKKTTQTYRMKKTISYINTEFDLSGKVAIVTGGSGLLGAEFSKALASAGAKVIIADIDEDKLNNVKNSIKGTFSDFKIFADVVDITSKKSIDTFINNIIEKHQTIDILVNSAAIDPKFEKDYDDSVYTVFENFPLSKWNESIDVNLTGAFQITQAVCKIMSKEGKGSIINIGSNYGLVGPDQRIYKKSDEDNQSFKPAIYSVCKSALIGFTKYLAAYYAGTKIRVNMLTPAGVSNNHDKEFERNYSRNTIMRRMSNKDEYWGSIIFLASDASSYMTGSNLVVDGGWTSL